MNSTYYSDRTMRTSILGVKFMGYDWRKLLVARYIIISCRVMEALHDRIRPYTLRTENPFSSPLNKLCVSVRPAGV